MKKFVKTAMVLLMLVSILVSGTTSVFASAENMRDAYSAKQYDKAVSEADMLLESDETYMDAYYVKSMSLLRLGDIRGAYDTLLQQLSFNPKNQLALYNAACSASLLNLEYEAVDLLKRLLTLDCSKKSDIRADSDFDNIRNHPDYQKLMEISVIYGGELLSFDTPPVIINDRTLLPFRGIFEAFDASVSYTAETQTVTAQKDGFTLELVIGEQTAIVNGESKTLDSPPMIINDRTFVPVRFVSESLGANVDWNGDDQVISILTVAPNAAADYDYTSVKTQLDSLLAVLPIDGMLDEPYSLPVTEGMTLLVWKDAKGLELFDSLSESDKSRYVSDTVYDNFGLVIGCEPVHVKVVYDGKAYYEGEFHYDNRDELPLLYYVKGKPVNVVKQYKYSTGGNYKDFYQLPAEEQVTSKPNIPDKNATSLYSVVSAPNHPTLLVSQNQDWTITMPSDWTEYLNIPGNYIIQNPNTGEGLYVQIRQLDSSIPDLKEIAETSLKERVSSSTEALKTSAFESVTKETINGLDYYRYATVSEAANSDLRIYSFSYFVIYNGVLFEFGNGRITDKPSEEFMTMVTSFHPGNSQ